MELLGECMDSCIELNQLWEANLIGCLGVPSLEGDEDTLGGVTQPTWRKWLCIPAAALPFCTITRNGQFP